MKFRRFPKRIRKQYPINSRPEIKSKLGQHFTQFILVLAGGLVGILGNQFFFERNKKLETNLEIRKEFFRDQLPLYNRIINFTYYYQTGGIIVVKTSNTYRTSYDPFGLIYARDTTIKKDTSIYKYPSFVEDTMRRNELYEDIDIIKKNKDKIDGNVWRDFTYLAQFLENHPLPDTISKANIFKSGWTEKVVYNEWEILNSKLYLSAKERIEKGF